MQTTFKTSSYLIAFHYSLHNVVGKHGVELDAAFYIPWGTEDEKGKFSFCVYLAYSFAVAHFVYDSLSFKNLVSQLDSELESTHLQLIEKESELHAKTTHCQQLELKVAKGKKDMKQMMEDYSNRMKSSQVENSRSEAAILDYAEKLRKIQVVMFDGTHAIDFIHVSFKSHR